ncbi:hypothetical protein L7F22_043862 [Adiantum nelumboides]|nr:hypothetical protein [Adiantum nelumboides]
MDIEAGRHQNLDNVSNDIGEYEDGDGLDIADQLLASLEARDKAAERVQKASIDEERANGKHHSLDHIIIVHQNKAVYLLEGLLVHFVKQVKSYFMLAKRFLVIMATNTAVLLQAVINRNE